MAAYSSSLPSAATGTFQTARLLCILLFVLLFSTCCAATPHVEIRDLPTRSLLGRDGSADLPHLRLRDDQPSSTTQSTSTASTDSKSSASASATPSQTALPQPFDTSLGSNFTQASCPTFFESFLTNSTFKSCVPVSLLLQNSHGFFVDQSKNTTLNPVLDASCAAQYFTCAPLMSSLATQLIASSNCAADYQLGNPLVLQAYHGFLAYAPMFNASCLKADPAGRSDSKNFPYCFTSAHNSSSAADSMLYFLPLGLTLPGGSSISCSACTQKTMQIYADAASNTKSPLNTEYGGAADMINRACGANFVSNASVIKTSSTSAPNEGGRMSIPLSFLLLSTMAIIAGQGIV